MMLDGAEECQLSGPIGELVPYTTAEAVKGRWTLLPMGLPSHNRVFEVFQPSGDNRRGHTRTSRLAGLFAVGAISLPFLASTTSAVAASPITSPQPSSSQSSPCSSRTSADPSGIPMPATSPAGWKLIFSDNFTKNVAAGSWPGSAYGAKWTAYGPGWKDTSGAGTYETKNISVADSCLTLHLATVGGVVEVAAPIPLLPGSDPSKGVWAGQKYGMYSVCFKADAGLRGFKTAWLLWTDSNIWADGEIDFPEGDLGATINGYVHNISGDPSKTVLAVSTDDTYLTWHVATIKWTAAGVTFILDGKVIGSSTVSPSVPMHWVIQTETDGGAPDPLVAGNVYIDWAAIYAPAS